MMNLCQECRNYKIKVTQHLFLITKIVALDNLHNLKKRINNCNNKPINLLKGDNLMKTNKIILTKKRRNLLTHDKKLLYNRKL